jgi:N-methylhydantoinase A
VREDSERQDCERDVVFDDPDQPVHARVAWRPALAAGVTVEGPAVIEEPNATTLIHPGDVATVTGAGHLLIRIAGR